MDAPGTAQMTLQPVFIPRQHSSINRNVSIHQPGSPSNSGGLAAAAASADWAFLLRNAAAFRNGSFPGTDSALLGPASPQQDFQNRATSPQVLSSPGHLLMTSSAQQAQQAGLHHSASGVFGSNSVMHLDALGQLSADALASATGDPSNSFGMLPNSTLASTLSGMYNDGGVQTLYGSNDTAAVASAAAAAAAAAAARATTTQSILQQQAAAAAASNANLANSLGSGAFAGLSGSLNLNNYMKMEESLSGTLFGPGGAATTLSPKPVSASLYIKVGPSSCQRGEIVRRFSW